MEEEEEKMMTVKELPGELIFEILLLLPKFKETVAIHLISKSWKDMWKSRKRGNGSQSYAGFKQSFVMSIYKSLDVHYDEGLERVHRMLSPYLSTAEINFWLDQAKLGRGQVRIDDSFGKLFSTTCRSLKTLFLHDLTLKDFPPTFHLPSLKSLHLSSVRLEYGNLSMFFLIRVCPVLEDLVWNQTQDDDVMLLVIGAPTVKRLSIHKPKRKWQKDHARINHGFVIITPRLEELNLEDTCSNYIDFEKMDRLMKANIISHRPDVVIGSLLASRPFFSSLMHLSLCSRFNKPLQPRFKLPLINVELCTCSAGWVDALCYILHATKELESIKLNCVHSDNYNGRAIGYQSFPKSLSSDLEILEWTQYVGTVLESKVAEYILANATNLKMATFSSRGRDISRKLKTVQSFKDLSACRLLIILFDAFFFSFSFLIFYE